MRELLWNSRTPLVDFEADFSARQVEADAGFVLGQLLTGEPKPIG